MSQSTGWTFPGWRVSDRAADRVPVVGARGVGRCQQTRRTAQRSAQHDLLAPQPTCLPCRLVDRPADSLDGSPLKGPISTIRRWTTLTCCSLPNSWPPISRCRWRLSMPGGTPGRGRPVSGSVSISATAQTMSTSGSETGSIPPRGGPGDPGRLVWRLIVNGPYPSPSQRPRPLAGPLHRPVRAGTVPQLR